MSTNRRRNANLLPVAKILLIGMLLLTVGGGALFYVNAKNEVHRNGQLKKNLERELLALETKDEVSPKSERYLISTPRGKWLFLRESALHTWGPSWL